MVKVVDQKKFVFYKKRSMMIKIAKIYQVLTLS